MPFVKVRKERKKTNVFTNAHETEYILLSNRWRPEMDILMDQLGVKLSQGNQFKKSPIKTTEPQEFSLTEPKPRPLPVPELIPQQEQSKTVSLIYSYIQYFL